MQRERKPQPQEERLKDQLTLLEILIDYSCRTQWFDHKSGLWWSNRWM